MKFLTTNFSTRRERIGVTDIVRKSENDFTDADFGIGVTSARFHANGGRPVCKVVFTKLVTTDDNSQHNI